MIQRCILTTAIIAGFLIIETSALKGQAKTFTGMPAWVREHRSVPFDSIPAEDFTCLANWVSENAQNADDWFISLYTKHDMIIFGEYHNIREHKDFIIKLIPRLYHEAGVRCIGWEFSTPASNAELAELVNSPTFSYNDQLDFARRQVSHAWAYKEHWDFIEAIRKLNSCLPPDAEKMKFVGIDMEIDWVDVYTKLRTLPKDSPEFKKLNDIQLQRDVIMAGNAAVHTLNKGIKALLFVGSGHAETHFGLPPNKPYRRPIMGQILFEKFGERVYHVAGDFGGYRLWDSVMKDRVSLPVGFDIPSSPFAGILVNDLGKIPTRYETNARGFIYFGPAKKLHRNTFIEGFVTDEMFRKYKDYYEIDFSQKFNSAGEVNDNFRKTALSPL